MLYKNHIGKKKLKLYIKQIRRWSVVIDDHWSLNSRHLFQNTSWYPRWSWKLSNQSIVQIVFNIIRISPKSTPIGWTQIYRKSTNRQTSVSSISKYRKSRKWFDSIESNTSGICMTSDNVSRCNWSQVSD